MGLEHLGLRLLKSSPGLPNSRTAARSSSIFQAIAFHELAKQLGNVSQACQVIKPLLEAAAMPKHHPY